jgi:hypothetical protein
MRPGIVYTGKAGFLDLGHLWQVVEVTAFAYQTIHAAKGATGTKIRCSEGEATLTSTAPAGEWLELARSIAYDDALAHEIWTYWVRSVGLHHSSFSPEDLPSNYLGTVVAARALAAGGPFVAAVERELKALMVSLDAQDDQQTRAAFGLIANRWVDTSPWLAMAQDGYLRRRNFTRTPWKTGHPSDSATPAFVTAPFVLTSSYDFRVAHGVPGAPTGFTLSQFPAQIAAIRADAAKPANYGPSFDQPT